ncbi:DNA-directed RNA polymerase subunit N [Bradyrhizobium sp. B097]|uniref:DNA-directed RNA polymerase subunit N n=1 Tax=Bradyrhizobium sp. B097 TaxID=3140244 RepID=UPI0031831C84
MFKRVAIAILGLSLALPLIPSEAAEQHRGGDAALGALSGGIIFGPIGAVAGAVVGYTAGPSISHSLGVRSHQTHARRTKSVRQAQASTKYRQPAPDRRAALPAAAPAAAPAPPPPLETATTMPPVQPLE